MDVLKDILDNLNDSILILDGNGRLVFFNAEARRIQKSVSGKPLVIGSHITEVANDDRKKTLAELLKTIKRQKKPVKNFAEFTTDRGTSMFLEISFVPVMGVKKELRFINIITEDITSRKVFEKKMRTVAADVSNVIEYAHALIFSVDSKGYVVEWNHHCEQVTGFAKKDALSQRVEAMLIRPGDATLFSDLMSAVLLNRPVGKYEMPLQSRSGQEIIVMLSATPRTNSMGQVIGATLVGQDITELTAYRRSLEKQVESNTATLEQILKKEKEAVELKSRFVSIASHEFRSPLSSIDFAANFIKQNAATIGKKKLNEKVKVIEKHVSHMSHLLEDVLNFSKSESGRIKLIPSEVCLQEFVRETVEEVACHVKHSHHICVSTNHPGTLLTDAKLLRNIVINLLTNAIKFSPGKEEVSLSVVDEGDAVTFEICDEGIGIPENEIQTIFQPFVRGSGADGIHGTGLGLSIVKKAVELLNGNVNVESVPGKGSAFKVTLPRQSYLN